jgi:hypothetical protein
VSGSTRGIPAFQRPAAAERVCAILGGPRFVAWAFIASLVSLVAFGLASAIIPNPVFGRQIPPEPFAIATWLISAPLSGLVLATWIVPATIGVAADPGVARPLAELSADGAERGRDSQRGGLLATAGGFGTFLAIGCPVCNKIALLLLGASGALTFFAPIQPFIGAASLALLAGTLAWRLRMRARGGVCPR